MRKREVKSKRWNTPDIRIPLVLAGLPAAGRAVNFYVNSPPGEGGGTMCFQVSPLRYGLT